MPIWEIIAEKAKKLPMEKQRQVLDFIEFLAARTSRGKQFQNPAALLADLGVEGDVEALSETRRRAWGAFLREIT
jgi:hypothetical protein